MALTVKLNDLEFGVGDEVRIHQKIKESKDKTRVQIFEGIVIGIKGSGTGKSYTVGRVGSANVGIEKIFPVETPTVEKVEVVRKGTAGVRQSKLYYIRKKSKKEIEKIFSRSVRRSNAKVLAKNK